MIDLKKKLSEDIPNMNEVQNEHGEYIRKGLEIKPVYDVANNKLHYQTEPYLDTDGKVKVKRLASFDVEVHNIHQVVEEYTMTKNYGEEE